MLYFNSEHPLITITEECTISKYHLTGQCSNIGRWNRTFNFSSNGQPRQGRLRSGWYSPGSLALEVEREMNSYKEGRYTVTLIDGKINISSHDAPFTMDKNKLLGFTEDKNRSTEHVADCKPALEQDVAFTIRLLQPGNNAVKVDGQTIYGDGKGKINYQSFNTSKLKSGQYHIHVSTEGKATGVEIESWRLGLSLHTVSEGAYGTKLTPEGLITIVGVIVLGLIYLVDIK